MQTNNEIEVISRDAVLLSAINGLSGYMFGNDKELWQDLTAMRLSIIIPDSIENDQDGWIALYVFIIANITENIEIEAKILELFRSNEESRNNLFKIN